MDIILWAIGFSGGGGCHEEVIFSGLSEAAIGEDGFMLNGKRSGDVVT